MKRIISIDIKPEDFQRITRLQLLADYDEESISGKFSDLRPLDLDDEDLQQVDWLKYYKDVYDKKQIVLHHTVSGSGISGDLAHLSTFESHIAVCIIIARDGTMYQLFSSKYWGYHLGVGIEALDCHSIAVELDNWGQLHEENGKIYNIYGSEVNCGIRRYERGFRGEQLFEAYTEPQVRALGELCLLWNQTHGIPLDYHPDMWDVSEEALNGKEGIWTHVSFRPEGQKWDCHPDPLLIDMLRTLPTLV